MKPTLEPKWYYSKLFLCFVFALSFLIIPFFAGVILLIASYVYDRDMKKSSLNDDIFRQERIMREDAERQEKFKQEDAERQEKFKQEDAERQEKFKQEDAERQERIRQDEFMRQNNFYQEDAERQKWAGQEEDITAKLRVERLDLKAEIKALFDKVLIETINIDPYMHLKSDEIRNKLSVLRLHQNDMLKKDKVLTLADTVQAKPKRVQQNLQKQILRGFNAESAEIINSVSAKNSSTSRNKLQRSFEQINKLFELDGVQLTLPFLEAKFEELSLVYGYMVVLEEEKETQRAIREEMLEEERVRREIDKEKLKIEKEEQQFSNEIKKLMKYMQKASDIEKQLYVDKIKELEEKLQVLSVDKENVFEREQNTRAGFVYVISNIGSLGENTFKIGMTRRLEPLDRIKELSSASVPFPFDVHAMIFSHDAPALENTLHQTFKSSQVNKMNHRKEFFNIELNKIKNVVLANHNDTVHFNTEPDAFEYRETLKLLN